MANQRNSGRGINASSSWLVLGLLAAGVAGEAAAQQAEETRETPEAASEQTEEEIIVVGTRASLRSALDRRRRADTVVDSIVAEDIGQFPDKNVGEALSRISGLQLSRSFGEGAQVSIRGIEPDLNRVEINGQTAVTALGNPGFGGPRAADLRYTPAELVQSIDVYKGSTADLVEGGIGGTVLVEMRKPLQLEGPLIAGTLSEEKLTTQGGWRPRGALTLGSQFFDRRFGVLFNYTYDELVTRNDYLRNHSWGFLQDWDNSPEKTRVSLNPTAAAVQNEADCAGLAVTADQTACRQQWFDYQPRIPRYGIWYRDEERSSAQLTLQFRLTDEIDVWAETTSTKSVAIYNDANYQFSSTALAGIVNGNCPDPVAGVTVNENHIVTGFEFQLAPQPACGNPTVPALTSTNFGTASRAFSFDNTSDYYTFGANYAGEQLTARLMVTRAEAENFDDTNNGNFGAALPGARVDVSGPEGIPRFTFLEGESPEDLDTYNLLSIQYRPTEGELVEDQLRLDIDFVPRTKFITSFEAGLRFTDTRYVAYGGGGYTDAATGTVVPSANVNINANLDPFATADSCTTTGITTNCAWTPATFQAGFDASATRLTDFYSGYDGFDNLPDGWISPDTAALIAFFNPSNFNHDNVRSWTAPDGTVFPQIPGFDITEETAAFYLKLNYEFDVFGMPVRGNIGVREVATDAVIAGQLTRNEIRCGGDGAAQCLDPTLPQPPLPTTVTVTVGQLFVRMQQNYSDTLPSFNMQIRPVEDVSIRFGAAKVMTRPRRSDLRPNATCTFNVTPAGGGGFVDEDDTQDCTSGNPALEPFRATTYDLEVAYYPTDEAEIRFGLFRKEIDTYTVGRQLVTNVDLFGDGRLLDVNMPVNGQGATTQGFEFSIQSPFSFLPSPFDGLGGVFNYTYSEAENINLFSTLDGAALPFPGLSEHAYNLILYYDKGPINTRVAYNYRSDWLVSANNNNTGPAYRKAEGFLDARFSYSFFADRITFFVEGKNLTDQIEHQYVDEEFRSTDIAWPGRRYFTGVSFKY